jgi:hypothetical protein
MQWRFRARHFRDGFPGTGQAVILLVVGWLVLCCPWFTDGRIVPYDSKDQFYPFLHFVAASLRAGESPFWNPYIYGGYPMVSDPQEQELLRANYLFRGTHVRPGTHQVAFHFEPFSWRSIQDTFARLR